MYSYVCLRGNFRICDTVNYLINLVHLVYIISKNRCFWDYTFIQDRLFDNSRMISVFYQSFLNQSEELVTIKVIGFVEHLVIVVGIHPSKITILTPYKGTLVWWDAVLQKWLAWALFCCYQTLCVVSQQSWFRFFLFHKFSNYWLYSSLLITYSRSIL